MVIMQIRGCLKWTESTPYFNEDNDYDDEDDEGDDNDV